MKRVFLGVTLVALIGCAPTPQASNKLNVAASFYPLAFLAREVGGDLVSVVQITPGGTEPHDYEPSSKQIGVIQDSNVFLINGAGVDTWGEKLLPELQSKGIVTVRMTDSLTAMDGFSEGDEPSSARDPHLWLSPPLFEREAGVVRDAFIAADPTHQKNYRDNMEALAAKLRTLDAEYRRGLRSCAQNEVFVSHNAFRYLAKEYGFQTVAIAGLDPEQEPSPKRIAALSDLARAKGVNYIFFETLVSPKLAETLAKEIGAEPLVLNPLEGLTKDEETKGENYFSLMRQNLVNLRTALQCR